MNDLQTSLLLIGGGAIAIMVFWNILQDRRARAQGAFPDSHEGQDPLLGGQGRVEPTGQFNDLVQQAFIDKIRNQDIDRELDRNAMEDLFGQVFLWFDPPQSTDLLMQSLSAVSKVGSRPVFMHVTVSGDEDRGWQPLAYGQTISNLRLSVLLANRKGAMTAIEWSTFASALQPVMELGSSHVDMPDMDKLVAQAQRLDRTAAGNDATIGLHCVLPPDAPLPGIEAELTSHGWVREGRHWSKGLDAEHLASVVVHEAPGKRVLSFTLDLPNCCDPLKALNEIAEFGNVIATQFKGSLMDDAGRGLTAESFLFIRNQMLERASALHDEGFSPGSLQARLLFS